MRRQSSSLIFALGLAAAAACVAARNPSSSRQDGAGIDATAPMGLAREAAGAASTRKALAAAAASARTPSASDAAQLSQLIARLPKAELHIHIEGTLEPDLMLKLAARNGIHLPWSTLAEAKAARENYADLQAFLDVFQLGAQVLVTQLDFHELAEAFLAKAAANNITHVELFFDAQNHAKRGVPMSTVVGGLQSAIDARRAHPTHPIDASLLLCLVRELGELDAAKTLAASVPYLPSITGLGLASAELGNPPENYRHVFKTAGLLGLHKVAHAGEEGGPEYVWGAIRALGAQRIDHGIHSLEDPELVAYMVQAGIPITLCPVSNLQLKVFGAELPAKLRAMLASGITITINSDDPAYFGAYLNANYEYIAAVGSLDAEGLAMLAKNSFTASFIPVAQKRAAYEQIDAVLAAWQAERAQSGDGEQGGAAVV